MIPSTPSITTTPSVPTTAEQTSESTEVWVQSELLDCCPFNAIKTWVDLQNFLRAQSSGFIVPCSTHSVSYHNPLLLPWAGRPMQWSVPQIIAARDFSSSGGTCWPASLRTRVSPWMSVCQTIDIMEESFQIPILVKMSSDYKSPCSELEQSRTKTEWNYWKGGRVQRTD